MGTDNVGYGDLSNTYEPKLLYRKPPWQHILYIHDIMGKAMVAQADFPRLPHIWVTLPFTSCKPAG